MNIVLFYEHLVREWDAICLLRDRFIEKGNNAKAFSIIFERTKALSFAKKNTPDIVFMPWFMDSEQEEIVSVFVKFNPSVKIINLHHEEIGSKNSEKSIFPTTPYTKNGSFHFVWSEYFKNRLNESGVRDEYIVVTGNIRNDLKINPIITRGTLSEKYGLCMAKRWILFAENRGWFLSKDTEAVRTMMAERGVSGEEFTRKSKCERENIDDFSVKLSSLSDKFVENFEFIYRPHPGTSIKYDMPDWVHVISDFSIYDWINSCDLFLTCESTSIFEAEMCGKPCAIVPSLNKPDECDRMIGVWDYPQVNDVSEIDIEKINAISKENLEKGSIYQKYLGKTDGCATERVVDATYQIYNIEPEISCEALSFISKEQQLRQIFYEKITWIMVKLHLLDKLHYPRSAYAEKRDIPYSDENRWIYEVKR